MSEPTSERERCRYDLEVVNNRLRYLDVDLAVVCAVTHETSEIGATRIKCYKLYQEALNKERKLLESRLAILIDLTESDGRSGSDQTRLMIEKNSIETRLIAHRQEVKQLRELHISADGVTMVLPAYHLTFQNTTLLLSLRPKNVKKRKVEASTTTATTSATSAEKPEAERRRKRAMPNARFGA
ncbi:MAG: hypothetical protein V4490_02750 [Pseudomonadota bacterium]